VPHMEPPKQCTSSSRSEIIHKHTLTQTQAHTQRDIHTASQTNKQGVPRETPLQPRAQQQQQQQGGSDVHNGAPGCTRTSGVTIHGHTHTLLPLRSGPCATSSKPSAGSRSHTAYLAHTNKLTRWYDAYNALNRT
jgi:hypothetical protein